MTWYYQLMKHTEPDGDVWYGVHEFYDVNGYTVNPMTVMGGDKEEIKWMLEAMLEDIEKRGVKDYGIE